MRRAFRYALWTVCGLVAVCVVLVLLFASAMWGYFAWHWESEATRKAIYAEAQVLMHGTPAKDLIRLRFPSPSGGATVYLDSYVPPHVPKTIASLKPYGVAVERDGVFISTRKYFDDDSGYFVPRDRAFDPHRRHSGSWTPIGDGVWWYHLS